MMLFDANKEPIDIWDDSTGVPIAGIMLMLVIGSITSKDNDLMT